jgi:hypothetical protein
MHASLASHPFAQSAKVRAEHFYPGNSAMTLIPMPPPLHQTPLRPERPTASSNALPPVAVVAALPDQPMSATTRDGPAFSAQKGHAQAYRQSAVPADDDGQPQPFPELRFADPLPNLPELDLPAKAAAYGEALTLMRPDADR